MSKKHGYVKVKLITGAKFWYWMPGPPPPRITIEAPAEVKGQRGSRVVCKRVDVDEYQQMSVAELFKAGILKLKDESAPVPNIVTPAEDR